MTAPARASGGRLVITVVFCVTAVAMFGQIGFFHDQATPPHWDDRARWALAGWIAITAESIGLFIGWHAQDALLRKNHRAAFRRRLASYATALVVAGINYWHFSEDGHATPLAVIFFVFSASTPWLWGMHTRREVDIQLVEEGRADSGGARLDSSKWRHFPLDAWGATRYSILHNITDPHQAWDAYRADQSASEARQEAVREQRRLSNHEAAGGSPLRALWVRMAGAIAPAPGGAATGATLGAMSPARGGATAGVTPVRPAPQSAVAVAPAAGATEHPAPLRSVPPARTTPPADGPVLQEAAARWALAHDARREPIPGWRPILDEFGPRGLTEYRAKEAAKAARERAAGSSTASVGGQAVVIRAGANR